jgi:hypothetical protein
MRLSCVFLPSTYLAEQIHSPDLGGLPEEFVAAFSMARIIFLGEKHSLSLAKTYHCCVHYNH